MTNQGKQIDFSRKFKMNYDLYKKDTSKIILKQKKKDIHLDFKMKPLLKGNISHTQTRNYINTLKQEYDYKVCNTNPEENKYIETDANKKQKNSYDTHSVKPGILLFNQFVNASKGNSIEKNNSSHVTVHKTLSQSKEKKEDKNFIQVVKKSLSKSPGSLNSITKTKYNKEIIKNQIKQLEKVKKFNKEEEEINNKHRLFNFKIIEKKNNNAQIPYEYFNDFLDTYVVEEDTLEYKIIPNFMEKQNEINGRMRAIIVNWIIEVHNRFKLLPDTLFLSIIIFDRYMSLVKNIKKDTLQLIGVTSLLIACKYEEIFSPEIRDFVCILDRTYEREDLMNQENEMMKKLKFEITFPTSLRYFEILRVEFNINEKYYDYGYYLLELTLLDCNFSKYKQCIIATTICFMIKKLFEDVNLKNFLKDTKINYDDVINCLIDICFLIDNIENSCYHAVTKKHYKVVKEFKKRIFEENKQ